MDYQRRLEIIDHITSIASPFGLRCIEVRWFLRNRQLQVFLDREQGQVGHDECALVAKALQEDQHLEDQLGDDIFLEVSSPGVERPIRTPGDFRRFQGRKIFLESQSVVDGRKRSEGILADADDEHVSIDIQGAMWACPVAAVKKAHLVHQWS